MASVLEEKDAIRELLHEYCYRLDQHRFVELAELFTEDGEWITPYARAKGRAEMAALWSRIVPLRGEGPARLHYVMNTIISVHGDRAEARSNYLVVLEMPDGLAPSVCGTYSDVLRKDGDAWRIERRELIHHLRGEMKLKVPA